jgi:methionine--tRNA ligase beta chain
MGEISFQEFKKLDLRIGQIKEAKRVESSRNLIQFQVDFGSEKRQAVAGLANHYKPEQLEGNKYMFICNLERKKIMGINSECMIFAADDGKGNIILMKPERDIDVGSIVK